MEKFKKLLIKARMQKIVKQSLYPSLNVVYTHKHETIFFLLEPNNGFDYCD